MHLSALGFVALQLLMHFLVYLYYYPFGLSVLFASVRTFARYPYLLDLTLAAL